MKASLKIGVLMLLCGVLATAFAEPPLKSYKDIPSPEGNARRLTEAMTRELGLTEKQSKKVYKIHLAEQKKIFAYKPKPILQFDEIEGLGEFPSPEAREDGGRPPMGGGFGGMGGGFPPMPPGGMGWEEERPDPEKIAKELKKAAQKRDKKLKKALDEGQYARWKTIEKDLLEPFLFEPEQGKPGKPEPGV